MSEWVMRPLGDVADIRISNVDKKSSPKERGVRLCNYMDVYAKGYLTDSGDYMQATCEQREINSF